MTLLIESYIKDKKDTNYLSSFRKDLKAWEYVYIKTFATLSENLSMFYLNIKNNKKISMSNNICSDKMSYIIKDSLDSVCIMAYRYGVFSQNEYKNINASKFIGQFIFDFMKYLPVLVPKNYDTNPRRVNARVALHIMKTLISLSDNTKEYNRKMKAIKILLKDGLESEIVFKLADRQLTEEWLYIYCKTIRKIVEL